MRNFREFFYSEEMKESVLFIDSPKLKNQYEKLLKQHGIYFDEIGIQTSGVIEKRIDGGRKNWVANELRGLKNVQLQGPTGRNIRRMIPIAFGIRARNQEVLVLIPAAEVKNQTYMERASEVIAKAMETSPGEGRSNQEYPIDAIFDIPPG